MKTYVAILGIFMGSTAALAQTAPQPAANASVPPQEPSVEVKALGNRLMQEINNSLRCEARVLAIEEELAKLKVQKK